MQGLGFKPDHKKRNNPRKHYQNIHIVVLNFVTPTNAKPLKRIKKLGSADTIRKLKTWLINFIYRQSIYNLMVSICPSPN